MSLVQDPATVRHFHEQDLNLSFVSIPPSGMSGSNCVIVRAAGDKDARIGGLNLSAAWSPSSALTQQLALKLRGRQTNTTDARVEGASPLRVALAQGEQALLRRSRPSEVWLVLQPTNGAGLSMQQPVTAHLAYWSAGAATEVVASACSVT